MTLDIMRRDGKRLELCSPVAESSKRLLCNRLRNPTGKITSHISHLQLFTYLPTTSQTNLKLLGLNVKAPGLLCNLMALALPFPELQIPVSLCPSWIDAFPICPSLHSLSLNQVPSCKAVLDVHVPSHDTTSRKPPLTSDLGLYQSG